MHFHWGLILLVTVIPAVITVHSAKNQQDDHGTRCHNVFGIYGSFHGWSGWSSWSKCSTTCGIGFQSRQRLCYSYSHLSCPPGGNDVKTCWSPCPGGWSSWSIHSCSKTCGGGIAMKHRTCTNPIPLFGGQACSGPHVTYVSCNTNPCQVNGSWSSWQVSSQCSVSCGGGVRVRTRTCDNPAPSNGGQPCQGISVHKEICNTQSCPVPTTTQPTTMSTTTPQKHHYVTV
ncbi:thrombospondin-1-like isoform X2 [Ostrea edulis]|uniref:thrombospondin-1-like isoform X2 n=1 Tax=Ostrea edulis TaxID=37623 RepID=UPI002095C0A2|nr:thrombospondin-1-like isoform X2 [Ostrea edulis]